MTCIEEYEEDESEQTQISARKLNESDDEYVPSGEKQFRKSFNQKELTVFILRYWCIERYWIYVLSTYKA